MKNSLVYQVIFFQELLNAAVESSASTGRVLGYRSSTLLFRSLLTHYYLTSLHLQEGSLLHRDRLLRSFIPYHQDSGLSLSLSPVFYIPVPFLFECHTSFAGRDARK
jgi:hypothetical protein